MFMLRLRPFFMADDICTHQIGTIQGVCVSCEHPVTITPLKFERYQRKNELRNNTVEVINLLIGAE